MMGALVLSHIPTHCCPRQSSVLSPLHSEPLSCCESREGLLQRPFGVITGPRTGVHKGPAPPAPNPDNRPCLQWFSTSCSSVAGGLRLRNPVAVRYGVQAGSNTKFRAWWACLPMCRTTPVWYVECAWVRIIERSRHRRIQTGCSKSDISRGMSTHSLLHSLETAAASVPGRGAHGLDSTCPRASSGRLIVVDFARRPRGISGRIRSIASRPPLPAASIA